MTLDIGTVNNFQANETHYQRVGCEADCTAPQDFFTFHYGRRVHTRNRTMADGHPGRAYEVGGLQSVRLCRTCINRYHRNRIARISLLTMTLIGVTITGIIFSTVSPLAGIVAFISFLATLICSGILLGLVASPAKLRGEELAIALCKEDLQRQGFDLFWHSGDYAMIEQRH